MVWYSHLFKNFSQLIVIHIVKGFCIVNEAEVDVFLEFFCFLYDPTNVGNLISGSSVSSCLSLELSLYLSLSAGPKIRGLGTSLELQWLRLHHANAGGMGLSLVRELRSHMLCSKAKR